MTDRASMRFWWPKLKATGVPTPATVLLESSNEIASVLDGKPSGAFDQLCARIANVGEIVGTPFFLRTGHGSGKHEWRDTCYVTDLARVRQHVYNLIEWSCVVDPAGLPVDCWAVRKLLDVESFGTAWAGMPITRERRFFVEGGRMLCHHPYWPLDVLDGAQLDALKAAAHLSPYEEAHLQAMSEQVSDSFGGAWSLDWLCARDGWYAIDMAPAERSWHWPGCRAWGPA